MRAQKVLAVPKWAPKKSQPSLSPPFPPIANDCSLMAIKFVTPARVLLFSSFSFLSYFLFNVTRSRTGVNFPPFRDLRLGWFHSTVPVFTVTLCGFFDRTFYVAYTDTFRWRMAVSVWLIAGGVSRGETTSGEASKARNEAVVIAG